MPSFEPEEVAETIAQLLGGVDAELRELNERIDALSREEAQTEQTLAELRWLRRTRIARVSQLLERNDGTSVRQADGPPAF